ncbi:MAG: hypothetical protein K9L66_00550 [Spirochaetaceae bacterium]|nr:hypothetical protein [Spirochaetaceae bacterium]MCF7947101.1 hypothetical protein [Spirochaetia bacterium]MCF7950102.1 hypothetical protein [Spirochaetaceae bacterium]
MKRLIILLMLLLVLFLFSCRVDEKKTLEREKLFELEIGKMEDQLDMLQLRGVPFRQKSRILMRNGLFFISNGSSQKVMEFTSYGDIVSLYYNADQNPEPFLLNENAPDDQLSNRQAFKYPFKEVGEIAVTSDKTLLVEDRVSEMQQEYDKDIQAMLNRVVLRFDQNGTMIDYLGREGRGGTPFPYIESIQVTNSDEIVVISRSIQHWFVYWFSSQGSLLYEATISRSNLPLPEGQEYLPSLGSVTADIDEHLLYLKIDYYGGEETDGGTKRDIYFQHSRIWWYDLKSEKYAGSVTVPVRTDEYRVSEFEESKKIRSLYELMGNSRGNVFFLMTHDQNELFELLLLRRDGTVIQRNYIEIPEESIVYRDFHLNHDGVLSALLVHEYSADVVWWRTDRFLEEKDEDSSSPDNG